MLKRLFIFSVVMMLSTMIIVAGVGTDGPKPAGVKYLATQDVAPLVTTQTFGTSIVIWNHATTTVDSGVQMMVSDNVTVFYFDLNGVECHPYARIHVLPMELVQVDHPCGLGGFFLFSSLKHYVEGRADGLEPPVMTSD